MKIPQKLNNIKSVNLSTPKTLITNETSIKGILLKSVTDTFFRQQKITILPKIRILESVNNP